MFPFNLVPTFLKARQSSTPLTQHFSASRLSAKASARLENVRVHSTSVRQLDFALTFVGAIVIGIGVSLEANANIGFGPIDVMGSAISSHLGVPFAAGAAIEATLGAALATALGRRVSPVAIATTATIIGTIAVVAPVVPTATVLPVSLALFACGIVLIGLGVGSIVAGDLGIGPYEQLTFALCERTGFRSAAWMRSFFEFTMLSGGYLLGGAAGIGTLFTLITIGPSVQVAAKFMTNARDRLVRPENDERLGAAVGVPAHQTGVSRAAVKGRGTDENVKMDRHSRPPHVHSH